ncbi:hypothetical protein [Paraburkholderia sp. MM5384-R2]|uniref:hypothetical protein n=1 Tax=Paraburkholderia sp. MM5384-R2 TaxID=2723097 RepID=UPI00161CB78A|nr:hypothetical protein [Paraburkholderia sp. MM5384-R2]MBB5503491.1 hypothetical protein [Paraburkholderia sp. MM5384-R2]
MEIVNFASGVGCRITATSASVSKKHLKQYGAQRRSVSQPGGVCMRLNLSSSRRASVANASNAECEIAGKSIQPAVPSTGISLETWTFVPLAQGVDVASRINEHQQHCPLLPINNRQWVDSANSGGPVLDDHGRVFGINVTSHEPDTDISDVAKVRDIFDLPLPVEFVVGQPEQSSLRSLAARGFASIDGVRMAAPFAS